ncbi:hypothetical protein CEXT_277221, partial [Caerostris extrusa]
MNLNGTTRKGNRTTSRISPINSSDFAMPSTCQQLCLVLCRFVRNDDEVVPAAAK